jgi:hypothetical protein
MADEIINVGTVSMIYNKKRNTVKVWSQGYDTSIFDAEDFMGCVEEIKKKFRFMIRSD